MLLIDDWLNTTERSRESDVNNHIAERHLQTKC